MKKCLIKDRKFLLSLHFLSANFTYNFSLLDFFLLLFSMSTSVSAKREGSNNCPENRCVNMMELRTTKHGEINRHIHPPAHKSDPPRFCFRFICDDLAVPHYCAGGTQSGHRGEKGWGWTVTAEPPVVAK